MMKKEFKEPLYEMVYFRHDSIVRTSPCACNVLGVDYGEGANTTCTGANVSCTCDPNYDDPSANCT